MLVENKNPKDLSKIRGYLAEILPEATARAVQSYHQFADKQTILDAKQFLAHHAACKAALAHVEYLTKLAQWVAKQTPTKNTDNTDDLTLLVHQARLQLLQAQQDYNDDNSTK